MALGDMTLTVVGNLTDAPDLRFTPAGVAVAVFTVAVNPREWDRQANQWRDVDPSFVRVQAWRQLAEHAAESLSRGDRVIVTGRWREERWESNGEKRSAWRLTADAVGAELSWATATVKKAARRTGDAPPDDPWATASRTRPEPPDATEPPQEEPPF